MTDARDIGDVSMTDSLQDFASILGGVLSAPWLKGGVACIAVGCEAMGLPLDLVWCLAGLFVFDFALGIWLAVRSSSFSLRKFFRGLAKIPVYTVVIVIAWVCQYVVHSVLGQVLPVPLWACAYLAMHESLSILTKCEALDLPVPALLKRVLRRVNHGVEKKVDEALDAIDPKGGRDGKD